MSAGAWFQARLGPLRASTAPLGAYWNSLSARDRRVLGGGGALAALLLGWAFLWHPLALANERLAARVAAQRADLAWMRAAQQQIAGLDAASAHGNADRQGKSLLALADASARAAGLAGALKRVEPLSARSVRASFEGVNFDALVGWIENLSRDYGVQTSDLTIDRGTGNGLADARVTLEER